MHYVYLIVQMDTNQVMFYGMYFLKYKYISTYRVLSYLLFAEVKCSSLPELIDGKITPSSCALVKSPFGQTCAMTCRKGYKLAGPHRKQCTEAGEWTDPDQDNKCIGQ